MATDQVVEPNRPIDALLASDRWRVVRLGADIGIRCLGCDRRVMLSRRKFEKSVKEFIERGEGPSVHPLTDS